MLVEGPLACELREIGERGAFPLSEARRHHYVPAFLLARFGDPVGDRKGKLFQLDTGSGRPRRTTPHDACFVKDLYAVGSDDARNNVLESFFAVVERHAAPALARLMADPVSCSPEDRQTLSFFLGLQASRTPVALDQAMKNAESFALMGQTVEIANAEHFARRYRNEIDADASDELVEARRKSMLEDLASGRVRLVDPKSEAIRLLVEASLPIAEQVWELEWTVLTSASAQFVTSDRAMAMFDANLAVPWSGHGWESSPTAETTVPVGPRHCLVLRPGRTGVGEGEADDDLVTTVNLRTYGWARRFIYGTSQMVVSDVRTLAKARPHLVVRPRPGRITLLEEADPDDPEVGINHPPDWPKGLWTTGDDGAQRFCAYTVLDADDPRALQMALTRTLR